MKHKTVRISRQIMVLAATSACLASLIPTQGFAGNAQPSGFPFVILSGGAATATIHEMAKPFDNIVKADALNISFGKTRLEEIQKQFGGEVHSRKNDGIDMSWICYYAALDQGMSNFWFIANDKARTKEKRLTMVAGEETEQPIPGCSKGPASLFSWAVPVPGLGGNPQDLEIAFGASVPNGIIHYANERRLDGGSGLIIQELTYRLKDGKIDGVALSQITTK